MPRPLCPRGVWPPTSLASRPLTQLAANPPQVTGEREELPDGGFKETWGFDLGSTLLALDVAPVVALDLVRARTFSEP